MRISKGYEKTPEGIHEFVKYKPEKGLMQGFCSLEVHDSATDKCVYECTSENLITDNFYQYFSAGIWELILNNRHGCISSGYIYQNAIQSYMFSNMYLMNHSGGEESSPTQYKGSFVGMVNARTASSSYNYMGILRKPFNPMEFDSNGNLIVSFKYEFAEDKINNKPFNTIYWGNHATLINYNIQGLTQLSGAATETWGLSNFVLPNETLPDGYNIYATTPRVINNFQPYYIVIAVNKSNSQITWLMYKKSNRTLVAQSGVFTKGLVVMTDPTYFMYGNRYYGAKVKDINNSYKVLFADLQSGTFSTYNMSNTSFFGGSGTYSSHIIRDDMKILVSTGTSLQLRNSDGSIIQTTDMNSMALPHLPLWCNDLTMVTVYPKPDGYVVSIPANANHPACSVHYDSNWNIVSEFMPPYTSNYVFRNNGIMQLSTYLATGYSTPLAPTAMYKLPSTITKTSSQYIVITYKFLLDKSIFNGIIPY